MRISKIFALVAIVSSMFFSCTSEDSLIPESPSLKKTYKLKRDATGAYSIDFDDNTKVDQVLESGENTDYLLSSSIHKVQKNNSHELLIDNDKMKIGFIDADKGGSHSVTVIDDNISLQRKSDYSNKKLAEYSIQSNQDGTYDLDFSVNDNVEVTFVYNEETSAYEVHLKDGVGGEKDFSRTLEKEEDKPLRITFVTYIYNPNAKSLELHRLEKPMAIIH